jgi:hypothetical protein
MMTFFKKLFNNNNQESKQHDEKPYPYKDILHLWEDDYLMIEILPRENLDFIKNETRRICDFGKEHYDGMGFSDITPIGEKPVKTIEKLINISEIQSLFFESGLERIYKFHMQGVGLLEGKDAPIGYGAMNFAIMCNEQNGLLKDIWINNFPRDLEDQCKFKKALQLIGQNFNFILVDWFKCQYYNLFEKESIEELIKTNADTRNCQG